MHNQGAFLIHGKCLRVLDCLDYLLLTSIDLIRHFLKSFLENFRQRMHLDSFLVCCGIVGFMSYAYEYTVDMYYDILYVPGVGDKLLHHQLTAVN